MTTNVDRPTSDPADKPRTPGAPGSDQPQDQPPGGSHDHDPKPQPGQQPTDTRKLAPSIRP